jgi:MFS family permease
MAGRSRGYEPTYEETEVGTRHFRRNFSLGVVNGALYIGGLTFSAPTTILPVFVALFTKSSILIGLTGTMLSFGWLLPQLAVARYAEHLPTKKKLYAFAALFRLIAWLALVLSVMLADDIKPGSYLVIFFVCLGAFSLMGGASGIAFIDIVGKIIPPERRGRFFGYRRFFSGILAALAGVAVVYILGDTVRFPFPSNYFILFGLTFVFVLAAVVCFLFIQEPEGTVKAKREDTSRQYLSQVRQVLSNDHDFRQYLVVMILANVGALSLPFYVIYAINILGAPVSWVGVFVTIEMLATLGANLAWGYAGDAKGYRGVIRACTIVAVLTPVAALVSPNYYIFGLVFVLKGASTTGLWLAKNNYALEIAPVTRRPTYMGVVNTSLAFVMLLPLLGGVIVDVASYYLLFAVTGVILLASVFESWKLAEPRLENAGGR